MASHQLQAIYSQRLYIAWYKKQDDMHNSYDNSYQPVYVRFVCGFMAVSFRMHASMEAYLQACPELEDIWPGWLLLQ